MASVRFICGTQTLHRQLEERLSQFLGTEDTILFPSCFDANGGLFEGLLTADDAIISDSLNHASIIDGVRLCKAKRFRYANNDMADLEAKLQEADAAGARVKLISTDGVFSMDGIIAQLDKIHELAARYNAIVHFDDCHATGFLGERGRGTHEYRGLFGNHRHHYRHPGQGPGGRPPAAMFPARRKWWTSCARRRALTCSPTAWPPPSWPPPSRCWTCWNSPRKRATAWKRIPSISATP